jgi:D-galacturonate reductase
MAQPKQQLDTFKAWAGKSSDINYYLNSHHIDVHNWMVSHMSHPTKVTALAATGGAGGPLVDQLFKLLQGVLSAVSFICNGGLFESRKRQA